MERACRRFVGRIRQTPPMYSAVHHEGRRLYELAREGVEVAREAREVVVHAMDVLELDGDRVTVRVVCGKGTYVRALAADLGADLGCGAAVERLERVRVGPFTREDALSSDDLLHGERTALLARLLPVDAAACRVAVGRAGRPGRQRVRPRPARPAAERVGAGPLVERARQGREVPRRRPDPAGEHAGELRSGSSMRIVRGLESFPPEAAGGVAALGAFDGIHLGHRKILGVAVERARALGVSSLACTFDPRPVEVLQPARAPSPITTLDERLDLMAEAGIDTTVVLPFTRALAAIEPEAFIEDVMLRRLGAREIVVGFNHRFGRGARGDAAMLEALAARLGFHAHVVPPLVMEGDAVSSTEIRLALQQGDLERANRLLGRDVLAGRRGGAGRGTRAGTGLSHGEREGRATAPGAPGGLRLPRPGRGHGPQGRAQRGTAADVRRERGGDRGPPPRLSRATSTESASSSPSSAGCGPR